MAYAECSCSLRDSYGPTSFSTHACIRQYGVSARSVSRGIVCRDTACQIAVCRRLCYRGMSVHVSSVGAVFVCPVLRQMAISDRVSPVCRVICRVGVSDACRVSAVASGEPRPAGSLTAPSTTSTSAVSPDHHRRTPIINPLVCLPAWPREWRSLTSG